MDVFLNTADPQPPTTSNQPFKDTAAIFKTQDAIFKTQEAIYKPQDAIFKTQDAVFKPQDAIFKLQDAIFKPQDAAIFSHKTRNFDWTDISVFDVDSNASLLDSAVYKTGFLDINISAEFWRGDVNGTPCSWETCAVENGTSGAYQVGVGGGSDDKNWPFLLLILLVFNV